MPAPIFTAIEFNRDIDDDVNSMVTQPLLLSDSDEEAPGSQQGKREAPPSNDEAVKGSKCGFVSLGFLTGFFIQMVSLGAYSFLLSQYDEIPPTRSSSENDWFVYGILSVLTQVDLVIYVLIWIGFTCTMTRNGMKMIRLQYNAPVKRRSVFVLGVNFLVGIVLGAFLAWTMIDVYLGFPIPFVPIAATVVIDLVLCYLMVFCYDLGRENTTEDEDACACL
mmetsp:Transcript_42938/g.124143  ORF Transcript_42938/g.124143 Transcript_42938/m.124143 type:complete len:221 (+) Transcript_42938:76-738(+)